MKAVFDDHYEYIFINLSVGNDRVALTFSDSDLTPPFNDSSNELSARLTPAQARFLAYNLLKVAEMIEHPEVNE